MKLIWEGGGVEPQELCFHKKGSNFVLEQLTWHIDITSHCLLIQSCFHSVFQNAFHPDITVMVDWALKINYLSTRTLSAFSRGLCLDTTVQITAGNLGSSSHHFTLTSTTSIVVIGSLLLHQGILCDQPFGQPAMTQNLKGPGKLFFYSGSLESRPKSKV